MDGPGVVIAGAGVTRHGFLAARGWKDLVVDAAAYAALDEVGVAPEDVSRGFVCMSLPETFEQQNLGAVAADELGLAPVAFSQVGAAKDITQIGEGRVWTQPIRMLGTPRRWRRPRSGWGPPTGCGAGSRPLIRHRARPSRRSPSTPGTPGVRWSGSP